MKPNNNAIYVLQDEVSYKDGQKTMRGIVQKVFWDGNEYRYEVKFGRKGLWSVTEKNLRPVKQRERTPDHAGSLESAG